MKILLFSLIALFSLSAYSQNDHDWYSFGVQHMNKSMSAVSDIYGADHYSLINYPTCRGEFFTQDKYRRFELSGLFYYLIGLKNQNTPNEGRNLQTTTDRSMEKIQDYTSWEWMVTKMRNPEKPFNHGFGWQIGMRRFGFSDKGLLKTNITINPGYPDAGPYSFRSTLCGGLNYQLLKGFGSYATMRFGIVANAMAGIGKYGGMFYPELSLNIHVSRIAIIGTAAYETTYLYGATQKPFEKEAADNTGLIHGPRLELGFAVDLQRK